MNRPASSASVFRPHRPPVVHEIAFGPSAPILLPIAIPLVMRADKATRLTYRYLTACAARAAMLVAPILKPEIGPIALLGAVIPAVQSEAAVLWMHPATGATVARRAGAIPNWRIAAAPAAFLCRAFLAVAAKVL